GLHIVRTLVGSELQGSLTLQRRQPRGTVAVLRLPLTTHRESRAR
ncbi:MAG TPA: ATP-binding protein, partial [Pseudonocardiaceae bacterium]